MIIPGTKIAARSVIRIPDFKIDDAKLLGMDHCATSTVAVTKSKMAELILTSREEDGLIENQYFMSGWVNKECV